MSVAKPETAPVYRTVADPRLRLLIPLVVACAFFMEILDSTVLTTSIPQIARALGENPLRLNLAVTSYLLSLAVFIPISGWISDRFGARTVFCAAIVIFTIGSALCGAATSLGMMVATRILQGFGGALMTPVGRLIVIRSFPKEGLVQAMSYVTMPALIGPTLGPIVGGFLTTYVSWRWIFYINIPIGILGFILALRYCENFKAPAPPRFDFSGFLICGTGLAALEFVFDSAGRDIVSPAVQVGVAVLAAVALGLYGRHAKRTPNPAVDLRLFRIRTFRISTLAGGFCRVALGGVPFLLPLQLQLGFGMTAMQSGMITFVSALGAMIMKSTAPPILRRFGFRRLLVGNGLVVGLLIGGMALFTPATPHALLLAYLLVFGFLRALEFTCLNTLGYADLTADTMSRGTSLASVSQQLSMSFGVAVCAMLLALWARPDGTVTQAEFRPAYLIVALIPILSILAFRRLTPEDGAQVSGYHPKESRA